MKLMKQRVKPFMTATILAAAMIVITFLIAAGQNGSPQIQKKSYARLSEDGTLTGTIRFKGEAPRPPRIDMAQDPVCVEINQNPVVENAVINKGKLANVFVYVKAGEVLENYSFEPPFSVAELQHKGCRYVPHVLGIQTQQTLRVINSDPTTHNTHALPRLDGNPEWNISQAVGSEPLETKFERPEMFIPFKDNQHPWEKAYVWVFSHPFFAISGKNGSYKIEGLPAGDYTIMAWHERFGEQTAKVTIAPYETKSLDFTFAGPE